MIGRNWMNYRYWLQHWEKHPVVAWTLSILCLSLVTWLAFLRNLGSIGLIDETEPLFAEAARQMTVTDDWITPYYNGKTRFDKPPLIYWLIAIAYKIIGVNEWAVRLPSALAAIALTGFCFYSLIVISQWQSQDRFLPQKVWLWAGFSATITAFNIHTIAWGRSGVSDMLLSSCMGTALLAFFLGYAAGKPQVKARWYLAFYILSALAVLAKGPVGIVLPGLIIASFLLYLGKAKEVLQEMPLRRGLLIFMAIALPWYMMVTWVHGLDYLESFFGYHNIERFTTVVNKHSAPWYFYFIVVLVGFAPWSLYLPAAIGQTKFWQRRWWRHQPRCHQLSLFALFWFASIFGFFTIAVTKLPSYVLPLIPAAAILVSQLRRHPDKPSGKNYPMLWSAIANVLFACVVAGVLLYSPRWLGEDPAMPNLPQAMLESGLIIRAVSILTLAAAAATIFILARRITWLWGVNLLAFIAITILALAPLFSLIDGQRQLPLRQLAQTVVEVRLPAEKLIMIGFEKPSLVFYTGQPVKYYLQAIKAVRRMKQMAVREPAPETILILGESKKIAKIGFSDRQYQYLGKAGAYELLRVSKHEFLKL